MHDDTDDTKKLPKRPPIKAGTGGKADRSKGQKDHPKDTTKGSGDSGNDDAVWEHMTHDRPLKAPDKPADKPADKSPEPAP